MTSVEIPSSVAAALPTLAVFDITNEVSRDVRKADVDSGLAYVTPLALDVARSASPSASRASSATSRRCSPGSCRSLPRTASG